MESKASSIHGLQKELAACRAAGNRRGEAITLGNLGGAYRQDAQPQRAIACYEEAATIGKEIADPFICGAAWGNVGLIHKAQRNYDAAHQYFRQTLAVYEQGDTPAVRECYGEQDFAHIQSEIRRTLNHIATCYFEAGEMTQAIETYLQCLAANQTVENQHDEGVWLTCIGMAYANLGAKDQSRTYLHRAKAIFETLASPHLARVNHYLTQLDANT